MGWEAWCEPAPAHAGPVLTQEGYWGMLADADPEQVSRRLAAYGLRDDRTIVVYADGPGARGREGRIAWMLLYFGAPTVLLLDGGWSAWIARGGAVEVAVLPAPPGHFTARVQRRRRRTLDDLRTAYQSGTLPLMIDTRCPEEFEAEIETCLPRRGRLPGAVLVPFIDLFDGDGRYIGREHYLSRVAPEVREAQHAVAYCEVGVRASLFALLHEVYTGQIIPVFDGSLVQWGLDFDLPVAHGPG